MQISQGLIKKKKECKLNKTNFVDINVIEKRR